MTTWFLAVNCIAESYDASCRSAVERWQAETGRVAVLDGDGRSFAEVMEERIGTAAAEVGIGEAGTATAA